MRYKRLEKLQNRNRQWEQLIIYHREGKSMSIEVSSKLNADGELNKCCDLTNIAKCCLLPLRVSLV